MKHKVFIDGQEGTTGLQIFERLSAHKDVELLLIDEALRKDTKTRRELINSADAVFLCLPDAAAKESVSLVENDKVCVIDASTAHRTAAGWDYGFPELSKERRQAIKSSKRIANPGCYATGFIASVFPLVSLGILPKSTPITCHAVSGYSGAGKKAIAEYEAAGRPIGHSSPRQYALTLAHKHLPEMKAVTGIDNIPLFNPMICDFYSGMAVSVPLFSSMLTKKYTSADIREELSEFYAGEKLISVSGPTEDGFIAANSLSGTNLLKIYVCGNDEQITLISVLDNLGKGASGAAVQNMNLALGLNEFETLI